MLVKEYVRLAQGEVFKKKYRVQWLNLGDKNSKFFFNSIKNHQCRSKILSIHDDNDTCIIEEKKINDTIVNYFENLLGGLVRFFH